MRAPIEMPDQLVFGFFFLTSSNKRAMRIMRDRSAELNRNSATLFWLFSAALMLLDNCAGPESSPVFRSVIFSQ